MISLNICSFFREYFLIKAAVKGVKEKRNIVITGKITAKETLGLWGNPGPTGVSAKKAPEGIEIFDHLNRTKTDDIHKINRKTR